MAKDVVSRGNVGGDLQAPRVPVGGEHLAGVEAGLALRDEAGAVDFEELERFLVDGLAGPVAVGEVVDNGAGVRPEVPAHVEDVARRDLNVGLGRRGAAVADDVGVAHVLVGDGALVLCRRGPAKDIGAVRGAGVLEDGVPFVRLVVDDDAADVSVGSSDGRAGQRGKQSRGLGQHHGGGGLQDVGVLCACDERFLLSELGLPCQESTVLMMMLFYGRLPAAFISRQPPWCRRRRSSMLSAPLLSCKSPPLSLPLPCVRLRQGQ